MNRLILFLLLTLPIGIHAQETSPQQRAQELLKSSIKLMDEGKFEESISQLEEAISLDPEPLDYTYELGFAYYLKKDYEKSISICKTLFTHKDVIDRVYQLVGNSYDILGQPDKAIEIYQTGMKIFPNSGRLYLEAGVVERKRGDHNKAIEYWETGIKAAPTHSSNYYWLARTFAETEEPIWSFLYGEIFMNLELNSKRTVEISKLLYQNYENSLKSGSDSTQNYQLTKKGFEITISGKKDLRKLKKGKLNLLPFEGTFAMVYSTVATILAQSEISLQSIYEVRLNTINNWFGKHDQEYQNSLFDRQKSMIDAGVFEAYSYWIISQGAPEAFQTWAQENEKAFNDFATWIQSNRLNFESKDKYARIDY